MSSGKEHAAVALGTVAVGGVAIVGAASTDQTGPVLAFVGALVVALIVAFTAERRQERQLNHDRELHDVDGLRRLLDDTSALMYEVMAATSALRNIAAGKQGELTDADFQKASKAADRGMDGQHTFTPLAGRLLIHFDQEEPLFEAAKGFIDLHHTAIRKFLENPPAEELAEFIDELIPESGEQARTFRKEARRIARYRLPS